jgi:hypothetical protein
MLLANEPEAEEDSKDAIKEGQEKDGPDAKLIEASPSKFCDCAESNSKLAPLLRSPPVGETEGDKADTNDEPEEEGPPWMTPRTFLIDSKYFLTKCTFPDGHGTAISKIANRRAQNDTWSNLARFLDYGMSGICHKTCAFPVQSNAGTRIAKVN